ncbi:hypothetical protein LSAT2_010633, partial [Lamellibrachia satsuma]
MTSCFSFDFRSRTHSLDLAQAKQHQSLARLSRLFRSKSDSSVKKIGAAEASSPSKAAGSAPSAPAPARRRLMRVVRDAQSEGLEYENPHVIRKYTAGFWEQSNVEKEAATEGGASDAKPLPYTVCGHTILKKHGSVDSNEDSPPCIHKHTSFNEEVTIMEYDKKGKIKTGQWAKLLQRQRLNDTDEECDSDSDLSQSSSDARDSGTSLSTLGSSQSLDNVFFRTVRHATGECRCNVRTVSAPLPEEADDSSGSEPTSPVEVKWTLDGESDSSARESRTPSVDSDSEQPPKKSSKLDSVPCNCTKMTTTTIEDPTAVKLSSSPK